MGYTDYGYRFYIKIYNQDKTYINPNKAILIGDNVWMCNKVQILKGLSIANGCIVGSNTVVSKSLKIENAIYKWRV